MLQQFLFFKRSFCTGFLKNSPSTDIEWGNILPIGGALARGELKLMLRAMCGLGEALAFEAGDIVRERERQNF